MFYIFVCRKRQLKKLNLTMKKLSKRLMTTKITEYSELNIMYIMIMTDSCSTYELFMLYVDSIEFLSF